MSYTQGSISSVRAWIPATANRLQRKQLVVRRHTRPLDWFGHRLLLGGAALGCYMIHGAYQLYDGRPEDLLWACHLAAALIGAGLLAASPAVNAVGTLWLCAGVPLWLLDLAGGAPFYPTSCLTHLVGLAIGLYACTRLGVPRGAWWMALAGLLALIGLSRALTPARANVNVAFAIYPGWETYFPSHPVYLMAMMLLAAVHFLVTGLILRHWLGLKREENP